MNDLLADADICVKCGLCLSHCPTYTKTQNKNKSAYCAIQKKYLFSILLSGYIF